MVILFLTNIKLVEPYHFRDGQSQIGNCQPEIYPMKPGPGMFISRWLRKRVMVLTTQLSILTILKMTPNFLDRGCDLVFNVTTNGKTIENYIDETAWRFDDFVETSADWENLGAIIMNLTL